MACCIHKIAQTVTRCLLIWQLAVTLAATEHEYLFFEESYQPENNVIKLKNMVLDPNTAALYVGSVNRLYKLSEDLVIEETIETGPRQDHPNCFAPPLPCGEMTTTTDNINKLLVIDEDRLIVCGSIYQGSCVIRRLTNLSRLGNDSNEEIAANTPEGTSVAFIARGPYDKNVLYVATSYADWIDSSVPTLSSRALPTRGSLSDKLFAILQNSETFQKTSITIPGDYIGLMFNIFYIYGFSNTNFSYFVAVQPKDPKASEGFLTKIAQICHQDKDYYSYIELPLICKENNTYYNVSQSAYLATIGSDVAATSRFEVGEKVLFVTFSTTVDGGMEPVEASAVCMYSVKNINQHLNDRRKECALEKTAYTDLLWLPETVCSKSPYLVSSLVHYYDQSSLFSRRDGYDKKHNFFQIIIFFKIIMNYFIEIYNPTKLQGLKFISFVIALGKGQHEC